MTAAEGTRTHRATDVPVRGGDLRVGIWEDGTPDAPTVVAVHGVTASHLAWQLVAEALPGVRIVAPDLRGRGRSNELVGAAGMAAHADDLAAVFAHLGIPAGLVVGHSMGGFASVAFAHRHPHLIARLLLVDGGLPLLTPPGLSGEQLVAAILGPTAERLSMRFPDVDAYLALWRAHPAFAADWTPELEAYLAYDLVRDGERLRPATSYQTTLEDTVDLNTGTTVTDALAALRHPTRFLTVPRGLQNEEPGLYAPDHVAALLASYPAVRHERWEGLNHYTVVMSEPGARRVAAAVREELSALA